MNKTRRLKMIAPKNYTPKTAEEISKMYFLPTLVNSLKNTRPESVTQGSETDLMILECKKRGIIQ
jgi:hypothetical protein